MTVFLTNPVTISTLYYRLLGHDLPRERIVKVQEEGISLDLAEKIPSTLELLDKEGFEFTYDAIYDRGPWVWTHQAEYGYAPGHRTLEEATANAYWHYAGMYQDIHRLTKLGFAMKSYGDPAAFYWDYCNGNRISALFATEEAAWRDARRVDKEVSERVRSGLRPGRPGDKMDVHQAQRTLHGMRTEPRVRPAQPYQTIMAMGPLLEEAGYTIQNDRWVFAGCKVMVGGGTAMVIREAMMDWARRNPVQFTDAIKNLDAATTPANYGTEHLADMLQHMGYAFTPNGWNHASVDQIQWVEGGRTAVVMAAWKRCLVGSATHPEPHVAHKSQGQTWDKVFPEVSEGWTGLGNPPVNEECIVTPHNPGWGFNSTDPVKVIVRAYHGEFVWLQELDNGKPSSFFITTRTDKVDFSLYEENEQ